MRSMGMWAELDHNRKRSACRIAVALALLVLNGSSVLAAPPAAAVRERFDQNVAPLLEEYCYGCHADGANEGSMSFDALRDAENPGHDHDHWYRVLKQLRADLMPPVDEPQPSDEEVAALEQWILYSALGLDPQQPDPGKVTLRRLNRVEYRNTVRDLLGVDYDTSANFPADNTGDGFDNIGDVLSISPLLLEKYFDAAREIIDSAVPTRPAVMRQQVIHGAQFQRDGESGGAQWGPLDLSYYEDATARAEIDIEIDGDYQLQLDLRALESYVDNIFDLNRCELTFSVDGEQLLRQEFVRQGGKNYTFTFDRDLAAGPHEFVLAIQPLSSEEQVRQLRLRVESLTVIGPKDEQYYVKPSNYEQFFPREVPRSDSDRRAYARELLSSFAERAFRRPVDEETVERLVDLAEFVYNDAGETFESGIAKAMTAVLASPRFIFREEFAEPDDRSPYPLIDEHSLASRLSYFLWSSMPDEELIRLANQHQLRANLDAQVKRMLDDERSQAFIENFVGQWLKARAVESIQISARSVLRRESPPDPEAEKRRERFFELYRKGDERTAEEEKEFEEVGRAFRAAFRDGPGVDLTYDIRRAMRRETEMLFEHIVKNDRSLLELVNSNYTFLNEALAEHYGIEGVKGEQMRMVELPAGSLRGGVLTQGTVLVVTSNPDRTSPVKRGLFVLENILGMPPPAPPPDIPALEDAASESDDGTPLSLRETLALHRKSALCSSCHDSMDPLGLALDNFNAMGRYRDQELGQPIDPSGVLATGEAFSTVDELKQILVTTRQQDIYRCITEKLLTYALGRGVEYSDVLTVDRIVDNMRKNDGRASELLNGIIRSAAFQRTRTGTAASLAEH